MLANAFLRLFKLLATLNSFVINHRAYTKYHIKLVHFKFLNSITLQVGIIIAGGGHVISVLYIPIRYTILFKTLIVVKM